MPEKSVKMYPVFTVVTYGSQCLENMRKEQQSVMRKKLLNKGRFEKVLHFITDTSAENTPRELLLPAV